MSELKAIHAYRLTLNTEDSDVYIHNDEFGCGGDLVECYIKSEADKAIAELEETLKNSRNAHKYWRKEYLIEYKECRHQKYKRCMAMAKWCMARYNEWVAYYPTTTTRKMRFLDKWEKRWLRIAEQFKEAK